MFYLPLVGLNGGSPQDSATLVSKLISSLLFFVYFLEVKKTDEKYFIHKVSIVIACNFIVFAINMVLGNMGIGYNAYEDNDGFGSRGFFFSGNELAGVVVTLFPWLFYYIKTKYSFPIYVLSGGVLLFLVFTLSTKSAILATGILFLTINFYYGNKKEKMLTIVLSILIIGYVAIKVEQFLSSDNPIMVRLSYSLDKNGLADALTSSRLIYWEEERLTYYKADITAKIFGLGGNKSVEMDPLDALLNCGVVGLVFLVMMYIKLLYYPLKKNYRHHQYRMVVFYSNALLVFISMIAGHMLFSGMAGMFVALTNAILYEPQLRKRPLALLVNDNKKR